MTPYRHHRLAVKHGTTHPNVAKPVTLSGKTGDDARQYQEKAVKAAIEESKKQ